MSTSLRREAGVNELTNQHPIAFSILTLLVGRQELWLRTRIEPVKTECGYPRGTSANYLQMVQLTATLSAVSGLPRVRCRNCVLFVGLNDKAIKCVQKYPNGILAAAEMWLTRAAVHRAGA